MARLSTVEQRIAALCDQGFTVKVIPHYANCQRGYYYEIGFIEPTGDLRFNEKAPEQFAGSGGRYLSVDECVEQAYDAAVKSLRAGV